MDKKQTLLSASLATSFVYKVEGSETNADFAGRINANEGNCKIEDRVNRIYGANCVLQFKYVENDLFYNNLCMIDSRLPQIIAWMMADCYKNRDLNIQKAIERITQVNPIGYDLSKGHDFYSYKIKSLMIASAFGMSPTDTWNGQLDARREYRIVKDNGEEVRFHLNDGKILGDYLFQHTRFETPIGADYTSGHIYQNSNNEYFFNLNLQIGLK